MHSFVFVLTPSIYLFTFLCYTTVCTSKMPCNYGQTQRIESSSKSRNANLEDVQSDFICDAIIPRSRL